MSHACLGEDCPLCAYAMTEIEHPFADDGLADARAEMEMRPNA